MGNVTCPVSQAQVDEEQFESHIRRNYPDWINTNLVQNILKKIIPKEEKISEEKTIIESKKEEEIGAPLKKAKISTKKKNK